MGQEWGKDASAFCLLGHPGEIGGGPRPFISSPRRLFGGQSWMRRLLDSQKQGEEKLVANSRKIIIVYIIAISLMILVGPPENPWGMPLRSKVNFHHQSNLEETITNYIGITRNSIPLPLASPSASLILGEPDTSDGQWWERMQGLEANERSQPPLSLPIIHFQLHIGTGRFIYLKSLRFLLLCRSMHLNGFNEMITITNSDESPFLLFKNDNKFHSTCLKFQLRHTEEAATKVNLNRQ